MTDRDQDEPGGLQVLTSPGPAAIAVVRIWGPRVAAFVDRHIRPSSSAAEMDWSPGRVLRTELRDDHAAIDDILVSVHTPPPSWDLRLHLHGNPWLVRRCVELGRACGLDATDEQHPHLWASEDLLEAEAYALLPRMLTRRGAHWLSRQINRLRGAVRAMLEADPAQYVPGTCRDIARRSDIVEWFARPLRVVLAGPPNAGKSTLANALADQAACLVSPHPGTTRDWVEIPGEMVGFPVVWLDTAGLRVGADKLEASGVEQTKRVIRDADAIVVVLDITSAPAEAASVKTFRELRPSCVALNKCDLGGSTRAVQPTLPPSWQTPAVAISATERIGLDSLCQVLLAGLGRTAAILDQPAAFTQRQVQILQEAAAASDHKAMQMKLLQILGTSAPR